MFGARSQTVGLTLDRTRATIVKLRKKKSWEIDSVHTTPLPADCFEEDVIVKPDGLRQLLSDWVREQRLLGTTVTLAFPSSHVIVRRMRIQSTNVKELPGLIALEVETTLHLPFEDPIYDYVKLDEDEGSTQVLVFAASRQLVDSYVSLLENAGLRVGAIELAATALARAIRTSHDEPFDETMLINMDSQMLEIYMFNSGHPLFLKTIELYGGGEGNRDGTLTAGQLSEVTAEISRMLNFYQFSIHDGNSRITEALICGPEAGREQLLGVLKETQPEMSVRSVSLDKYRQKLRDEPEECLTAIGLALWRQDSKRISLLPHVDREARLYPALGAAALAVWLIATAASIYFYTDYRSELKAGDRTIAKLNDQIALLEGELQTKNDQQPQSDPLEIIERIRGGRRDAIAIVNELSGKLPAGSALQSVAYDSTGQIGLTVRFADYSQAARYLFDLKRMSFVSSAQLQSVSQDQTGGAVQAASGDMAVYTVGLKQPEGGDSDDGNDAGTAQ